MSDDLYDDGVDYSKIEKKDGYEVEGDAFVWYCSLCGKRFLDEEKPTENPTKPCTDKCRDEINMYMHLGGML